MSILPLLSVRLAPMPMNTAPLSEFGSELPAQQAVKAHGVYQKIRSIVLTGPIALSNLLSLC